jgi:hypothetical protein
VNWVFRGLGISLQIGEEGFSTAHRFEKKDNLLVISLKHGHNLDVIMLQLSLSNPHLTDGGNDSSGELSPIILPFRNLVCHKRFGVRKVPGEVKSKLRIGLLQEGRSFYLLFIRQYYFCCCLIRILLNTSFV